MDSRALMEVALVLLGVLLVLTAVVAVILLRLPERLRLRRPQPEPAPRRVVEEQPQGKVSQAKARQQAAELTAEARRIRDRARVEAEDLHMEAERLKVQASESLAVQTEALDRRRTALDERDDALTERERVASREARELKQAQDALGELAERIEERERLAEQAQRAASEQLERLAGLTAHKARAEVLAVAEHDARLEAASLARDITAAARDDAENQARRLIVGAIQRVASDATAEAVVTTVPLPNDEMKGRIIGKEGRNIRAFEQITGVNVLVDDTPDSVLLSCFDPVRRETARMTLTELIEDGRIHPARIEDAHARNAAKLRERCVKAGEDACAEMSITDLHPDLIPVLGALQFRTSYGQNVLAHLIECGHLAALMASELGLDVATCRRAAFLHDIGKALTHEVEGSHALVGADLARRHGENDDIVHAIEAHPNEVEPRTVEAVLTQAADAISGSRPGARRESLEMYVKRLQHLERIAGENPGVDKVFAMQAGREVRVMVAPEQVSDAEAQVIARDIARRVQAELTYSGTIKITVVRESRAVEVAH